MALPSVPFVCRNFKSQTSVVHFGIRGLLQLKSSFTRLADKMLGLTPTPGYVERHSLHSPPATRILIAAPLKKRCHRVAV